MLRQSVAVLASGDSTERLRDVRVPTLVIHGTSDVICAFGGGRATAATIPGAELAVFDGMGHSLPRPLWPEFATRIAGLVDRVERQP